MKNEFVKKASFFQGFFDISPFAGPDGHGNRLFRMACHLRGEAARSEPLGIPTGPRRRCCPVFFAERRVNAGFVFHRAAWLGVRWFGYASCRTARYVER